MQAISDISFAVEPGETTAIIGPSGCGKSTTLKAVAGLNTVSSGRIVLGDTDITTLPTSKRHIGMVPQSYAVFPHMSVYSNVAYGLKVRGTKPAELSAKVDAVLALTQLTEFADRKPGQLSGGQRQRVALGRALAIDPKVLLLDEPLAALDPQLRGALRRQLGDMLRDAGCSTLVVTHDQHEALALANHIVVLKDGRLVQHGTPDELWNRPVNAFVADFLANSVLLDARVEGESVSLFDGAWRLPLTALARVDDARAPQLLLRPSSLRVAASDDPAAVMATVSSVEYSGGKILAMLDVHDVTVPLQTTELLSKGDQIAVTVISGQATLIGGNRA